MQRYSCIAILLLLLIGCSSERVGTDSERKAVAERFFRGVYGGNPTVVDELAGPDIVVSYPIFQEGEEECLGDVG
jgi:PBP1b-binding outer membrane lipoprotein LpoB